MGGDPVEEPSVADHDGAAGVQSLSEPRVLTSRSLVGSSRSRDCPGFQRQRVRLSWLRLPPESTLASLLVGPLKPNWYVGVRWLRPPTLMCRGRRTTSRLSADAGAVLVDIGDLHRLTDLTSRRPASRPTIVLKSVVSPIAIGTDDTDDALRGVNEVIDQVTVTGSPAAVLDLDDLRNPAEALADHDLLEVELLVRSAPRLFLVSRASRAWTWSDLVSGVGAHPPSLFWRGV